MGLVSDTVLIMGKSKATVLGKGSEEPIRASVFSYFQREFWMLRCPQCR